MAVSFIGGGNRRQPLTCRKSLTNFILETKMAKISHTKIKQPSFGEKRPKLTYTKISRFMVFSTFFVNLNFFLRDQHKPLYHIKSHNMRGGLSEGVCALWMRGGLSEGVCVLWMRGGLSEGVCVL
jgi:hypothetical protein